MSASEPKATIAKAMFWIGGSLTLPGLPEDEGEGEAPADLAPHLSLAISVFSDMVDGKTIATFGGTKSNMTAWRQSHVWMGKEPLCKLTWSASID